MSSVGTKHLQGFLIAGAKKVPPNTMHDIKLHLKKVYAYLYATKQSASPYTALLSFKVNHEANVCPCLPQTDVAKLLNSINRHTRKGKRNYAAMALGAELGLRACDVILLKLTDIYWINGEIKILQAKTGNSVILLLTSRMGDALQDYIINARRGTDSETIFETLRPPYTPIKLAVTLGEIYPDCCKAVGLPATKRFHTLRSSLGTAMITNGVSISTAAQVFGDAQMNSMKQYISLDSKRLKCCASPFDGITPIGGVAQ